MVKVACDFLVEPQLKGDEHTGIRSLMELAGDNLDGQLLEKEDSSGNAQSEEESCNEIDRVDALLTRVDHVILDERLPRDPEGNSPGEECRVPVTSRVRTCTPGISSRPECENGMFLLDGPVNVGHPA